MAKDNKCSYLFLVENGDGDKGVLEVLEADSFKAAIKELATVAEYNMDLFNKCLVGLDDEDVDGIIELFDTFCDWHIYAKCNVDSISKLSVKGKKHCEQAERKLGSAC